MMKRLLLTGFLFLICLFASQSIRAQYPVYGNTWVDYNSNNNTFTITATVQMDYYFDYYCQQLGISYMFYNPSGNYFMGNSTYGSNNPWEVVDTFSAQGCGTYRLQMIRWEFLYYNVYAYWWNGSYVDGFYDPVSYFTMQYETTNPFSRFFTLQGNPPDMVRSDTYLTLDDAETFHTLSCPAPPTVASLSAEMPSTPNPVPNSTPVAPGILTTSNTSTDFATESTSGSDYMVVFQSPTDTITITANGVTPSTGGSQLRWKIERDNNDPNALKATGLPTLGQPNGIQTSITPTVAGNFRLICFYDANNNGNYDAGEELRILLFSVVRVELDTRAFHGCTIDSAFPEFAFNLGDSPSDFEIRSLSPMSMSCDLVVKGGGADMKIGLNKVNFGNVGNLLNTSAKVNYASSLMATENPGGSLPMVDTGRVTKGNSPTGGITAFRNSSAPNISNYPGGGKSINIFSEDAPSFGFFKVVYPNTTNTWLSTEGGYDFREFIVGYSASFPNKYVVAAKANWTIRYIGTRNTLGEWDNNGSGVTLQGATQQNASFTSTLTNGSPQNGADAEIQVLGLSYVNENCASYGGSCL